MTFYAILRFLNRDISYFQNTEKRNIDDHVLAKSDKDKQKRSDAKRRSKDRERHRERRSSSKDKKERDRSHHHHHGGHHHHGDHGSSSSKHHHHRKHSKDRDKKSSSKERDKSSHDRSSKERHSKDRERHSKDRERHSKDREDKKSHKSSSKESDKVSSDLDKTTAELERSHSVVSEQEEAERLLDEERQKSVSEKLSKAERMLAEFKNTVQNQPILPDDDEESPSEFAHGGLNEEVSSTVNIKTPETPFDDVKGNPIVWNGEIDMPDVVQFSVRAQAVSGTTDYLTLDLRECLKIVGRIGPQTVWDYISQVAETPTKEIIVLRLHPSSKDEKEKYDSFYSYLEKRHRFGVVGNNNKMVKDCYILPLSCEDKIHSCLLPLDGPGLEEKRPDMLLALIVRSKRKRVREEHEYEITLKKNKKQKLAKEAVKTSKIKSNPEENEEVMYDPLMPSNLGDEVSNNEEKMDDDDDDIYDPESAFADETSSGKKDKNNGDENNPQFSPPTDELPTRSSETITSEDTGGFTEQLAKLAKEIEKQKAELASMSSSGGQKKRDPRVQTADESQEDSSAIGPASVPGFQGLPSSISSILFGSSKNSNESQQASKSNTLSSMSDADLLAKVQEMEDATSSTSDTRSQPMNVPPPPVSEAYGLPQSMPPFSGPPPPVWNEPPPMAPPPGPFGAPPPAPAGPWIQGFEPPPSGNWRDNQFGPGIGDHPPWRDRGGHQDRNWRSGRGDNWRDNRSRNYRSSDNYGDRGSRNKRRNDGNYGGRDHHRRNRDNYRRYDHRNYVDDQQPQQQESRDQTGDGTPTIDE